MKMVESGMRPPRDAESLMTGIYTHLGENERKRSGLSESELTTGGVEVALLITVISIGRASPRRRKWGDLREPYLDLLLVAFVTSSL
jgi:hypothetical protein